MVKTKDDEDGVSDEDSFILYLIFFVTAGLVIGVGCVIAYTYGHFKHGDGYGQAEKFFKASSQFLAN